MAASPRTRPRPSTSPSGISKGKALGRSVLDLLGGPAHDRLPAIASCHAHHELIPEMAEETAGWVSTGLQGLKTGSGKRGNARLGYDHYRDVAYVKAMREVLGDQILMIEHGIAIKWDVTDAVRRAKAMEEYTLAPIQEPLGAWDPEGDAVFRAKTMTCIAYGERERTLEQFERVLATGTVDVVGVDPGGAEGITGFKNRRAMRVLPPAGDCPCLVVGRLLRRRAWLFLSFRPLASCLSSNRCAIRCSTIW